MDYEKVTSGETELEMIVWFECRDDVKLVAFEHKPDLMSMAPRFMEPAPEAEPKPPVTGDGEDE